MPIPNLPSRSGLPAEAGPWRVALVNALTQVSKTADDALSRARNASAERESSAVALGRRLLILEDLAKVWRASFRTFITTSTPGWVPGLPAVTVYTSTGRLEITFGVGGEGFSIYTAYQVVHESTGEMLVSRESVINESTDFGSITNGSGDAYRTVIVDNLPKNTPIIVSLHVAMESAPQSVSMGSLLVRMAS